MELVAQTVHILQASQLSANELPLGPTLSPTLKWSRLMSNYTNKVCQKPDNKCNMSERCKLQPTVSNKARKLFRSYPTCKHARLVLCPTMPPRNDMSFIMRTRLLQRAIRLTMESIKPNQHQRILQCLSVSIGSLIVFMLISH